jgi:glutamine phosphoribosylpyrophosphate amidotransferase
MTPRKNTGNGRLDRAEINVTTLKFQKIDDMIAAIGLPGRSSVSHCWTGEGGPACCTQ